MSELVLKTCDSLKEAIKTIKSHLVQKDKKNLEMFNYYKENNAKTTIEDYNSMEERHWNDQIFLVYRTDKYIDEVWLFENEFEIESWLKAKWYEWNLWEFEEDEFLKENLIIWHFHRNICKEKWKNLYSSSKPFIEGWSRRKIYVNFEFIPSFSVSV